LRLAANFATEPFDQSAMCIAMCHEPGVPTGGDVCITHEMVQMAEIACEFEI
jgi:hypothetical protein